jgi:hypothetical protein
LAGEPNAALDASSGSGRKHSQGASLAGPTLPPLEGCSGFGLVGFEAANNAAAREVPCVDAVVAQVDAVEDLGRLV